MIWPLIVIAVLAIMVVFKFKDLTHRVELITIFGILLFGTLTVGHVYKVNDIDLSTFDGFLALSKVYVVWVKQAVNNVGDVTGYIVKREWAINATNSTG